MRLLEERPLAQRKRLKADYAKAFAGIGKTVNDTLEEHIVSDTEALRDLVEPEGLELQRVVHLRVLARPHRDRQVLDERVEAADLALHGDRTSSHGSASVARARLGLARVR